MRGCTKELVDQEGLIEQLRVCRLTRLEELLGLPTGSLVYLLLLCLEVSGRAMGILLSGLGAGTAAGGGTTTATTGTTTT